jgi:hypothetical protein
MTEPAPDQAQLLQWVEQVTAYLTRDGFPPIAARILGWLLICDPPEQSAAEIAAAIGASRASLTTNMQVLTVMGVVSRHSRPDLPALPGEAAALALRPGPGAGGHLRKRVWLARGGAARERGVRCALHFDQRPRDAGIGDRAGGLRREALTRLGGQRAPGNTGAHSRWAISPLIVRCTVTLLARLASRQHEW